MKKVMLMLICLASLQVSAGEKEECGKKYCEPVHPVGLNELITDICYNHDYHLNPKACISHYMSCINTKLSRRILDSDTTQGQKNAAVFRTCYLENMDQ